MDIEENNILVNNGQRIIKLNISQMLPESENDMKGREVIALIKSFDAIQEGRIAGGVHNEIVKTERLESMATTI